MHTPLEAIQTQQVSQPTPPAIAPIPDIEQSGAQSRSWQTAILAEYTENIGEAALRRRSTLAGWILQLTGRVVPEQVIIVDAAARWAMTMVDGVMFQLSGHDLVVVLPCAHCGTGRFESAPITSRIDLGYTLAAWQPFHGDCEPTDPNADVNW